MTPTKLLQIFFLFRFEHALQLFSFSFHLKLIYNFPFDFGQTEQHTFEFFFINKNIQSGHILASIEEKRDE